MTDTRLTRDGGARRTRRAGWIAGLVALGMVAAAACGGDDDSSEPDAGGPTAPGAVDSTGASAGSAPATAGGVDGTPLVIARNMDLTSLDPHRAVCDTCQFVFTSLYQTLVGLDTDNKTLIPGLADSWEVNEDSTVYTFHLAPEATFSDGSPVEAKDVEFSLLRLKNLKVSLTYLVDDIESIEAPDDKTVVVTLANPNAEFLNNMNAAYTVIVNSDVAVENGATSADDADTTDNGEPWFIQNSAGSGPYVLESFTQGDSITLMANPNYWKDAAPISTVTVQQVETAAAQAQMLQTGDADIAMQIDPITAKTLENVDSVVVQRIPSFNFIYLALWPGITVGTSAPIDDTVRQAIRVAIDYQAIVDTLLDGAGQLQPSAIPNGFPGSDGLEMPVTDPEEAKRLLAEAGVTDLTMTLGYPTINAYGVDFGQIAQLLQQQLAEVGITLELAPETFSVMIEQFRGFELSSNLLYWAPDYYGSAQYVSYFGLVEGSRAAMNAGGSAESPLIDPVTQEAYDAARASADPTVRTEQYEIAGAQMLSQNIIVPLMSPDLVLAAQSNIDGLTYSACCNIVLDRIHRTS